MPDYTDPTVLRGAVIKALGERTGSTTTKAVAYWKPTNSFWAVKQGGYLKDEEISKLKEVLGTDQVFQAWPYKCDTKCATTTGFHAEMIIVSAHLKWQGYEANKLSATQTVEWKKLTVAANCDCCIHCQLAMKYLGVMYIASDYGESNTAWWSPVTDIQINKHDPQFSNGKSLLLVKEQQSTY